MLHRMALYVAALGVAAPLCWAGNGLKGEYFGNTTLTGPPVLTRTDAVVAWVTSGSPGLGVPASNFSIRWTGQVQAPSTGSYRFATYSDDAVRLWVNGALVIDAWTPHFFRRDQSASVTLVAGQKYTIKMEYFKSTGLGAAILMWAIPRQGDQVITRNYLFDTAAPALPGAPSGLSAAPGDQKVTLAWSAAPGAASYNVYRGTASGGQSATPIATGIAGTGWVNSGLTNGTKYFYRVAAVNEAGVGSKSNEAFATPAGAQVPPAPTGLTATPGNAQVTLAWAAVAGASSYNVFRSTTSGGQGTTPVATVSGNGWVNTGLTNNTTYYFKVAAVNAAGQGALSSQVSAKPVPPPVPAKPTGLSASAGNAQVTLNWNAQADANTYNVYRGLVSGAVLEPLVTGLTSPTYLDTGLTNNATYYYRVTAVNANGESPQSNQVGAKPKLPPVPAAPTG